MFLDVILSQIVCTCTRTPPCTRPQYVPPDNDNHPRCPFLPVDKKEQFFSIFQDLIKTRNYAASKQKYLQVHHCLPQYVQLPPVPASAKSSPDLQPDLMITSNRQ